MRVVRLPVVSRKIRAVEHRHPVLTVLLGLALWAYIGRQRGRKTGDPQLAMQQAMMTGGAFTARFLVAHAFHRRRLRRAAARSGTGA